MSMSDVLSSTEYSLFLARKTDNNLTCKL